MTEARKTFAISTLGCKVNQYEGQAIRERMARWGWAEVPFRREADLYIINTCTVTAAADEKCRKEVRRALRRNPNARVIVTGCAATTAPEQFQDMERVTAVLTREQMVHADAFLETGVIPQPADVFAWEISRFAGHTRGFIKIQDGCDARCAYCIVPRARGPSRSRPLQAIREEAKRFVASGYVELVLTGIHLGHYGRDLQGRVRLGDAIRAVLSLPAVERVRLSSLEASELTHEIVDLAASDPRLCPHFHLPLQSGDDGVLTAMNRAYTVEGFLATLDRVRERLELPSFTTDVMVGFPGETEARFENTLKVCRRAGFSRIHVFRFSPRPGTPAAEFPDRLPPGVIRSREARLARVADDLALAYKQRFLGRMVRPLVESRRDPRTGLLAGWTERYLRTLFRGPDSLMGRVVEVLVEETDAAALSGRRRPVKCEHTCMG